MKTPKLLSFLGLALVVSCNGNVDLTDENADTSVDSASQTDADVTHDAATPDADSMDMDAVIAPFCGDGEVNGQEDCENTVDTTCEALGFDGGTLACGSTCRFDTTGCTRVSCGNGLIDDGEDCEGTMVSSSCEEQGFDGGTLGCQSNCSFDETACFRCGDGNLDSGEACDGAALAGASCGSLGFDGGNLSCLATCEFNTTACFSCGDGAVNAGESCDGAALNNQTCAGLGFAGGTLGCTSACAYDTSGCFACGDNVINGTEQCDGAALNNQTCATQVPAKPAGMLKCSSTCQFDTSACVVPSPTDADNDAVPDNQDPFPNDNTRCGDADADGCDDCSVEGTKSTANDGYDVDMDGMCELPLDYACMNGANAAGDPYRLEACVMFTLINQDRALFTQESGGGTPVQWSEPIWAVAKAHAVDMCTRGYFAHNTPEGVDPSGRAAAAGLSYGLAENISVNLDPQASQYGFMEEPTCRGHRGNILQKRATEVGIGYHKCNRPTSQYQWGQHHHIVQDFRWNFSIPANPWCTVAANDCEIPPNPPTTGVCPQQLVGFGFCPTPDASTLTGWGCPND
ncbi:MAG: CAP domain-containing protein [bacterium]